MLIELGDPSKTTILIPRTLRHDEIEFPTTWDFPKLAQPQPLQWMRLEEIVQTSEGNISYKVGSKPLIRSLSSFSSEMRKSTIYTDTRKSIDNSTLRYKLNDVDFDAKLLEPINEPKVTTNLETQLEIDRGFQLSEYLKTLLH